MTPAEFTAKLAELEIRWRAQGYPPTSKVPKEMLDDLRKLYARNPVEAGKQLAAALKAGRQPKPAELERAAKLAESTKGASTAKKPGSIPLREKPVAAAKVAAPTAPAKGMRIRCRWVNPTPIFP